MKKHNKFIEFALPPNILEEYIVRDQIFRAIKAGANGIVLPSVFLPTFAPLIPEGINISAYVDYPNGSESTTIRQHCINSAASRGAKSIDLVAPHFFLLNNKEPKFVEDIRGCLDVCNVKELQLRVMLDYRLIEDMHYACVLLRKLGVQYILPSTGFFVDDFWDNLVHAEEIQKDHELNAIVNGNIYIAKHLECALKSKIFGVRFNNINALTRLMV